MALPFLALFRTPTRDWGTINATDDRGLSGHAAHSRAAVVALVMTVRAWRGGASRWLIAYAVLVTMAMVGVSAYFASNHLVGLRTWNF